jgi:hypothetical protein
MMILVIIAAIWVRAPLRPFNRDPGFFSTAVIGAIWVDLLVIDPNIGIPPVKVSIETDIFAAPATR